MIGQVLLTFLARYSLILDQRGKIKPLKPLNMNPQRCRNTILNKKKKKKREEKNGYKDQFGDDKEYIYIYIYLVTTLIAQYG